MLQAVIDVQLQTAPQLKPGMGHKLILQILQSIKALYAGRLVVVLIDETIAHPKLLNEALGGHEAQYVELQAGFKTQSPDMAEVDRLPYQSARVVLLSVAYPVDKVRMIVVENGRRGRHRVRSIAHARSEEHTSEL